MPRPGFDPTDPDSEGFADPGSDPRFYDNTPAPIATQEVAEIVARIVNSNPWVLGQPADKGLSASIAVEIERLTRERDEARLAYGEAIEGQRMQSRVAEARVASLTDQVGNLKAALGGLVDRLDVVHDDPRYRAVWELNQLRNGPYIGPNYWAELNAARAVATEPDGLHHSDFFPITATTEPDGESRG